MRADRRVRATEPRFEPSRSVVGGSAAAGSIGPGRHRAAGPVRDRLGSGHPCRRPPRFAPVGRGSPRAVRRARSVRPGTTTFRLRQRSKPAIGQGLAAPCGSRRRLVGGHGSRDADHDRRRVLEWASKPSSRTLLHPRCTGSLRPVSSPRATHRVTEPGNDASPGRSSPRATHRVTEPGNEALPGRLQPPGHPPGDRTRERGLARAPPAPQPPAG